MKATAVSRALGQGDTAQHPALIAGLVLDHMPVGMALVDAGDRIIWANEALVSLSCPGGGDLVGRRINELLRPFVHLLGEGGSYHTLDLTDEWQQAWLAVDDTSKARPGLVSSVAFHQGGDAGISLLTFVDLVSDTELFQAQPDGDLGSIASAWIFEDRLNHAFERADRREQGLAVMIIQLSGLPRVIMDQGAEVASRISRRAGRRLLATLRREDSVMQLDRQRFGVLVELPATPEGLHVVAERCLEALEPPFVLAGHSNVLIEPSIGIAMYPEDGESAAELMINAERATANAAPGTRAFFDGSMQRLVEERQAFRDSLQEALMFPHQHFHLVYQPQFSFENGQCCGLEALVRWSHPQHGEIEPEVFIGVAEEMHLIERLDRWVVGEVVEQRRRWRQRGIPLGEWQVAVNVHSRLFDQNAFDGRPLDVFLRQLDDSLDWLTLEINSSGLFEIGERHSHLLRRVTSLGVKLAIDGLGNSPIDLLALAVLPVSVGKVSPQTILSLGQAPSSMRQSILALVQCLKTLELESVAVGVETTEQWGAVHELGLSRVQGNLMSVPLDAAALYDWAVEAGHCKAIS
ncbi:EAL domain-containing protein [Halomonas huangheensis]|uniref:EAL domain-containing protein n=1 Tax=Halomonas huangheensis TaxID=1178482 RepID=W1N5N3_9GAMM|nr:EAL domain-containing protein [Halomonas huangheensis]ALM54268.1 hypothetical protein AR456_19845 [Halomonas huangheensis]ERL50818.1 hypothetical protein BJB45_19675 [Halomonas huangheensis]